MKGELIMKKIFAILLISGILVGCGSKPADKPDGKTIASITNKAEVMVESLSDKGNWITAITADITLDKELTVNGKFHQSNDPKKAVYRKLALHTQDDKFNVIDNFTLTTPKLVVDSENFSIFYGTVKGDILVNAPGFKLVGTKVEGNIIFSAANLKDSANLDLDSKGATVSGTVTVAE